MHSTHQAKLHNNSCCTTTAAHMLSAQHPPDQGMHSTHQAKVVQQVGAEVLPQHSFMCLSFGAVQRGQLTFLQRIDSRERDTLQANEKRGGRENVVNFVRSCFRLNGREKDTQ